MRRDRRAYAVLCSISTFCALATTTLLLVVPASTWQSIAAGELTGLFRQVLAGVGAFARRRLRGRSRFGGATAAAAPHDRVAHASNAVVPLPEEAGVLPAASGGAHEALEEQGGLQAYMSYMHGDEAAVGCQTAGGCCRSASALDCGSPQKVHHTCSRTC